MKFCTYLGNSFLNGYGAALYCADDRFEVILEHVPSGKRLKTFGPFSDKDEAERWFNRKGVSTPDRILSLLLIDDLTE